MFLQARLGSRRLPGKVLLPLAGATVLQHAMRALRRVEADVHALLTEPGSAAAFAPIARDEGFDLFVGSEEDVLDRFCGAAARFGVMRVVRATGDNPLVSPAQAASLLAIHDKDRWDLSHFVGPPLGTGVEVVEARALAEANRSSSDPYEHEHITTYLYRHPERYRVGEVPCPDAWRFPEGRVTLDTEEDAALISRIFQDLYRGEPIETGEVISWLHGWRGGGG